MTDNADKAGGARQSVTAALLVALLFLLANAQQTITGKVVGVSDGDTITVLDANKRLGHSKIQMVLRYAHPTEGHQAEAIRKMEEFQAAKQVSEMVN